MKATLYKELSNKQTPIEIPAGKSIKEALPDIDLENAIIIINGKVVKSDYILKENDLVTIRLTPAGTVALIVTLVVVAVVVVAAAVVGGILAYQAKQAAEKAQKELEKVKKLTNKIDIDNRPFLRSASNTLATGNSQPYIIGRHFFTPYLLSSPFYKITGTDGADEYINIVLECGFNKQIIQKIAIDDITIKTFSQTSPQEGAFNLDTGIFVKDGRVEIAQDGALLTDLPALNYKTESKVCNDEIPHDSDVAAGTQEYLTYALNPYAKDVDIAITFPYGLYATYDDSYKIEAQTTITPQYSLDGGSTWIDFIFDNNGTATNIFRRNVSTKELRYVAHKDFTLANYNTLHANGQKSIYIRIRKNGNVSDSKIQIRNDCYCLFYQSVCFDPEKSTSELVPCRVVEDRECAFCTVLGLKLKATKINENKLKKINIISHGVARTWNGTAWSNTKTATRNPAAWALEILTSDSHPASKYNDSEIDLDSFGDYYDFCELNGYKFDYVITQNMKKDDVLNYIMEATGACIYTDIYGRRAVAFDHPQENALAVYNPQNIIDIQNKKIFGRRTDALRIKWVNSSDDLFQEETYLLKREVDGVPLTLNENSIIRDITVTGITTFDHIVKYARRLMAVEILRPKTTIIEVGNEGIFYTPLSKILIQDDSLKIGIGKGYTIRECVWQSGLLKKICTNELLTFDPQKSYGIIVNCYSTDDGKPVAIKVEGTGTTDELTVLTTIRTSATFKPEAGNIFSFGELDIDGEFSKVTTEYLISDIKRSDKGFNLELVNYNEAIYNSGTIPAYKSNITKKATEEKKGIPADAVTHEELLETVATVDGTKAAQEAANEVVHGIHFTNVHRIKDMELSLEEILSKIDQDRQEAAAGISVSEEEILLKVADTEAGLYSAIDLTKDEILATVADTEAELRALVDVQSSAITAMVEGGGATGQMSLSLELPVMIDAATRAQFVQASTEEKVAAVYAQLEGTSGAGIRYAIKGNASNAAVKALWDDAVEGALIASQIDLTATQIHINAQNVQIDGETIINNAKKIKAAMIDVDTLLGNNAFFTGEIWAQESRFEKDVFLPMIEFCQNYSAANLIDIDMDTETPEAIKTKLDNILSYSKAINIDWDDTTNKRVYVYSVSNDKSRKNITPYSKASFFLQKYKDYQKGFIYYELGSVSAGTMFGSNSRLLISVNSNGTVFKHTSISDSNKIRMSYYAKEFGVNASAFFGATIESRQGYQFYEPNRLLNQSYSYSNTSGEYWKYCRMLGISYTPRLCCVKRNGGNYEIGVVYKESSNYVVNITGVTKLTFTEGSTSSSGVDYLMI